MCGVSNDATVKGRGMLPKLGKTSLQIFDCGGPAKPRSFCWLTSMEIIPEPDPDDEGTKISTVKVQGNDISHKLQISRVSKNDEGLYECRVTRANYGEIVEYKAQAWLKVNATARPRRPLPPPKKSSPLHLTDKKPRKSSSPVGQDNMSSDQRAASTSTSHTSSNTAKHNPGSGTRISSLGVAGLILVCGLVGEALL
uniref:V-set and transmembrane domain containing 2A n=1 Tax=Nothobranchius furzeri TaxID=105023 RepID=A0A8C6MC10_NOTFU